MLKVMIVDDDSTVYHVVKRTIPWEKYQMTVEAYAPNGEKAIEYLVHNSVDVVFVDLSMPHMGGLELIRRTIEFLPHTVFVILSSHSEYRLVKESFCIGAFDYLLKVDVDDEEVIHAMLKRVTDKLANIKKSGERPVDFGDLISKLDIDEKDTYWYKVQVLRLDKGPNRLKIGERLFQISGEKEMVYGCYEGNMVILHYAKEKKIIEEQQIFVNEKLLQESGNITASGASECGEYKNIESLYFEAMRNVDDGFWRIREYFLHNYARPELSLQIVADELNMSKRVVSKYMSEYTGLMFKAYLNDVRIDAAKEMLLKTNMRIQEVAYATGYMNVEHFTRTFTEKVGCSPSRYVGQENRENDD